MFKYKKIPDTIYINFVLHPDTLRPTYRPPPFLSASSPFLFSPSHHLSPHFSFHSKEQHLFFQIVTIPPVAWPPQQISSFILYVIRLEYIASFFVLLTDASSLSFNLLSQPSSVSGSDPLFLLHLWHATLKPKLLYPHNLHPHSSGYR